MKSDDVLLCVIIFTAVGIISVTGYFLYESNHNDKIINDAYYDAKVKYYIQVNENMSTSQKYDMIQLICITTFTNESFNSKIWDRTCELDTSYLIKKCECELMKI